MTKLKTVKDLGNDVNWIGRLILKKEAIKWVKQDKDFDKKYPWRDIFMNFHNITEEDLK